MSKYDSEHRKDGNNLITYLLNCDYFRILDGLLEPLERVGLVALLPGDCRLQQHVLVPRGAGSLTAADPEARLLYLFYLVQHSSLQLCEDVDWLSVCSQLLLTADAQAGASLSRFSGKYQHKPNVVPDSSQPNCF